MSNTNVGNNSNIVNAAREEANQVTPEAGRSELSSALDRAVVPGESANLESDNPIAAAVAAATEAGIIQPEPQPEASQTVHEIPASQPYFSELPVYKVEDRPDTSVTYKAPTGGSAKTELNPEVKTGNRQDANRPAASSAASNAAVAALENFSPFNPNEYKGDGYDGYVEPSSGESVDEILGGLGGSSADSTIYAQGKDGNTYALDADETGEIIDTPSTKQDQKKNAKGKKGNGKGRGSKSSNKNGKSKTKKNEPVEERESNITDSYEFGNTNNAIILGTKGRSIFRQNANRSLYESSIVQRADMEQEHKNYAEDHAEDLDYNPSKYLDEKFPVKLREDYRYYRGPSVTNEIMTKDEKRLEEQNRYYDLIANVYTFGLLPAKGAYIVKDPDTGDETERWDVGVESRRREICEYIGQDWTSYLSAKKIDQLIQCYGCIFPDSKGRWFGKHPGEEGFDYELSVKDQEKILDCILKSLKKFGHPFALPKDVLGHPLIVRGTEVIPVPFMTNDIAGFLLDSPNSQIRVKNVAGVEVKPKISDLMSLSYKYSREVTGPYKADDSHCSRNQAHIHDQVCFALGRVTGLEDEDTAGRLGLKNNDVYGRTIDYYLDSDDAYAAALNGKYGSAEIAEYEKQKLSQYELISEYKQGKKKRSHRPRTWREYVDSDHTSITRASQCIRLFTHIRRSVSAGLNAAIAASAILENAKGTGLASASIAACYRSLGIKKHEVSPDTLRRMMDKDGLKAFDAFKVLYSAAGPGGLRLFAQSNYNEINYQNVISFLENEWSRELPSDKLRQLERFLNKVEQKIMAGDLVCRKSNVKNWYKALILSSAMELRGLAKIEGTDEITRTTTSQVPLDPTEIDSIIDAAPSFGAALKQFGRTDACISALGMMRAHQIEQTNCMSYSVDQFLKRHCIADAIIATFADKFPKYGLNFVLNNIIPFTKTFNYLATRGAHRAGNLVAEDFSIEGTNASFLEGLKVNLVFDLVSLCNPLITGVLLGYVMQLFHFEEPEDKGRLHDISSWKVGGLEWHENYWVNDLVAWNLPIAVYTASILTGHDSELSCSLMMDCLYDQIDGNVLLDFAQIMKHYQEDIAIWKDTINTKFDNPIDEWVGYAPVALYGALVKSVRETDPISMVISQIANDTLIVGDTAPTRAYWKIFNKDEPWMIQYGMTKDINDAYEVQLRKNTMYSPLGAFFAGLAHGVFGNDKATGYFFTDMPAKETINQYQQFWLERYHIDYENKPKGMTNEEYDYRMAMKIIDDISSFDGVQEMLSVGYILPKDARDVAADYMWSYYNWLEYEYSLEKAAGTADWDLYNLRRAEVKDFIYTYLTYDNDIPTSPERYVEILTDKDAYYVDENGAPVPYGSWRSLVDQSIEKITYNKGNHPSTFIPFTWVDETNANFRKGYNAETSPTYVTDEDPGPSLEELRQINIPAGTEFTLADGTKVVMPEGSTMADAPVLSGKFMGEPLGEVMYGGQYDGTFNSPIEQTINQRSWMPKKYYLDPELYAASNGGAVSIDGNPTGSQALDPNAENPYPGMTASDISNRASSDLGLLAGTGATPNSQMSRLMELSALAQNGVSSLAEMFSNGAEQPANTGGSGNAATSGSDTGSSILTSDEPWKMTSGNVFGDAGKFYQDIDDYVYNNGIFANGGFVPGLKNGYYGYSSYRYSSGSSSYNPDSSAPVYIYNHAKVLNSDRPSTMNSSRPRNPSSVYLNPSFETKGSRESYKRQDI